MKVREAPIVTDNKGGLPGKTADGERRGLLNNFIMTFLKVKVKS